jgi:hypothetical protein
MIAGGMGCSSHLSRPSVVYSAINRRNFRGDFTAGHCGIGRARRSGRHPRPSKVGGGEEQHQSPLRSLSVNTSKGTKQRWRFSSVVKPQAVFKSFGKSTV